MVYETRGYDMTIVYDYKEYSDVHYGGCDNCDYTMFKFRVKDGVFLRECRQFGMKKSI
ncbi:hypothetical protein DI291_0240 [Bacillus paralicheniformis]|uniref:hypothetical protein n=1 Tax=Bacillus paralicheniformis TaxID=1648923 RepID=UPI00197C2005|nr:hypothetical protein [Bacillus paralicheniformis]QSF98322.1 hypothetical protein DI291_0240 [Bacillus paralicheniformis]